MDNNPKPAPPTLLAFDDAGRTCSVSRRTIERLVTRGVLRSVRVGRRRLIDLADLVKFVEKAKT